MGLESVGVSYAKSMAGKSGVSAFQNFSPIENRLNIKKVMSKDV